MEDSGTVRPQQVERPHVPWWRRTYLVNRDLQSRFARSAVLIGCISSALSIGIFLWTFWAFNIWQGQRLPNPVLAALGGVFLLNCFGIYVGGILTTQRITGPIYSLIRQMRKLSFAHFDANARFREDDEFHYLGKAFNEMVQKLAERDQRLYQGMSETLKFLAQNQIEAAQTELQKTIEALRGEQGKQK